MSTYLSTIIDARVSGTTKPERLSVALIGPGKASRQTLARALTGVCSVDVREFDTYPPERNDLAQMLAEHFEVVIVDVDTEPDAAFDLVERIGSKGGLTVMVYSERHDSTLAVRFMRAGAREYFLLPLEHGVVEEAFGRIAPAVRAKASIAGPGSEPSAGIPVELPKTLPADFMDWDSDDLCEMVLGNSNGNEVAAFDGEISNLPEQRAKQEAPLVASKGELQDPVPHFFWPMSADDKAGFPGRVVQMQDTRSAKTESPVPSSGSNIPIAEGKGDTLDVSKSKMQEADEVLFQTFRSAPKQKQGNGFASRALNIFRRERQIVSVFDDPHTSTV